MSREIKNKNDLNAYFDDFRKAVHDNTILQFSRIGEEAVKFARESHENNWIDHTGNLRASIGYKVTYKGKEAMRGGFLPSNTESHGAEGQAEGQNIIESIIADSEGYALVLIAGMNYAEYVQASGRDVLSGAELHARKIAKETLSIIPSLVENAMKEKGW